MKNSGKKKKLEIYFSEQQESLVVSQQPLPETQNSRASVPVYTSGWTSVPYGHIIPMTGLDFLIGVPEVVIQQTIEDCEFSFNTVIPF